jgi:integrase
MATVKFYYRSQKLNASITVRLIHKKEFDFFVNTQLRIDKKNWNFKKGLPKTNDADSRHAKITLADLETSILNQFSIDYNNDETINRDWLKYQVDLFFNRVKEQEGISDKLINNIDRIILEAPQRENNKGGLGLSKSRINAYIGLKNMLVQYQNSKRKTTRIKDVDLKFISEFTRFMVSENYSNGNIQKKIADIKTVCKDAQVYGIEVSPQLAKISGKKIKNDNIIYLTEKELSQIEKYKPKTKSLANAKKWLLLGSMVGQRGGDLLNLNESNVIVKNGIKFFELIQQKGNKHIAIPWSPKIEQLLSDGLPYKISSQKFNQYLKIICKESKINTLVEGSLYDNKIKRKVNGTYEKWKLISSHDLRRTFATNEFGRMPNFLIMSITGHRTEKTFLEYIGKNSMDFAMQLVDYYTLQAQREKKESQLTLIRKVKG